MERGESIKSDNWSVYLNFLLVNKKSINNSINNNWKNDQGIGIIDPWRGVQTQSQKH